MPRISLALTSGSLLAHDFHEKMPGEDTKVKQKIALTPRHVKAARGLLDWSQEDLAKAAGLSTDTVRFFENGRYAARDATIEAIREALEKQGIEFTNGDAPGARLILNKRL